MSSSLTVVKEEEKAHVWILFGRVMYVRGMREREPKREALAKTEESDAQRDERVRGRCRNERREVGSITGVQE